MFKDKTLLVLLVIISLGAFLRGYHFGDWMHYQLDQARDFRIIHSAMEYGPGELPLQGPRAAGSFLRLGPLLYYLEYLSALIFGNTPAGSVVIILLLNIAVIPVFYLFIRQFFDKKISLGLTGIFSTSLFMVVYSRFGWNPTLLPFFMTFFFYSILKASEDNKKAGWWLVLSSVALAFVTNMHFIALVVTPLIAITYFIWIRPKIALKWWLLSVAVFSFLNLPLIINDLKTNGENLKEFSRALLDRSEDKDSKHNIIAKGIKNIGAHAQYNWIILTGHQVAGLPEWYNGEVQCRKDCARGFGQGSVSLVMIILGIIGWVWSYRKEKNKKKKNFLKLVAIWVTITFLIFIPLAYDIAPRFFLLNAPLIFILFGFALKLIEKRIDKSKIANIIKINGRTVIIVIIFGSIFSNIFFTIKYFQGLADSSKNKNFVLSYNDRILKEKTRITLGQMQEIMKWIKERQRKNGYPVFISAQSEYERALLGLASINNMQSSSIPDKLDTIFKEGNYFVIIRTQSNQNKLLSKFKKIATITEDKNFGTLTIYHLQPKEEFISAKKKVFKQGHEDRTFSGSVQPRYLWRQIVEGCSYNNKEGKCLKD